MQHLLRKQIISIAILLLANSSVNAQKNEVFRPDYDQMPTHIGAFLGIGINHLNFERTSTFTIPSNVNASDISSPNDIHVNLGIPVSVRLTNTFLLRSGPMLQLNNKTIDYKLQGVSSSMGISSIIVTIPLVLKMQSNRYNAFGYKSMMRHYIFGGGNAAFDRSVQIKNAPISTSAVSNPKYLKGTNLGYEYGFGLSFFLRYVTISPEIKFSYGLSDINDKSDTQLLDNINKISSNLINFSIHIEN
jgi:hypothetical protein